jgi:hypothetical protein
VIREKDLYSTMLTAPLTWKDGPLATIYLHCEVRQITDVRNLKEVTAYQITCTQRIVLPSQVQIIRVQDPVLGYSFTDYPGMLNTSIRLSAPSGLNMRVVDYSPRTVNSTISAASSQGQGENQTFSRQHTSGSSTSETNTYGVNASVGAQGGDPMGSIGGDYSHSTTNETSQATTTGYDRTTSAEHGGSDSMTIKDWASYARLDHANQTPSWTWAQEYPSDVFQYMYFPLNTDGQVTLPPLMMSQLFEFTSSASQFIYPPSQLSLLGLDFTMKAVWLLDLPDNLAQQTISAQSFMLYSMATHGVSQTTSNGQFVNVYSVSLNAVSDEFSTPSQVLDLTLLGLDPIRDGSAGNGAVIGFIASKFIGPVPKAGSAFKILSDANTLQVTGGGFSSPMLTMFETGEVQLTVQFKIIDTEFSYTLFMKHWKTTAVGCMLMFVFNGDETNRMTRYVDWAEGEGGEDNLTSIVMRNKDYTSVDYHDYLVMGLNTVSIVIKPNGGGQAGYFLRALAIGES